MLSIESQRFNIRIWMYSSFAFQYTCTVCMSRSFGFGLMVVYEYLQRDLSIIMAEFGVRGVTSKRGNWSI